MGRLTKLELLEQEIHDNDVKIVYIDLKSDRIKAIYADGYIAINSKVKCSKELRCLLGEELGHHLVNIGNIIEDSHEEKKGRMWGFNKLVGLDGLIKSYETDNTELVDMADYLEVTDQYLIECLEAYKGKYGEAVVHKNYKIQFIPHFEIFKLK